MKMLIIIISILFGSGAQILLKIGANRGIENNGTILGFINKPLILGLLLYGLSALFWIAAISKVQLSYAYPMVSLGYVIVCILSFFVFGESITLLRVLGLCTIILGVILISKS